MSRTMQDTHDTQLWILTDNTVIEALKDIIQHLGYDFILLTVPAKKDIAERLSALVGKEPAWSDAYVTNVLAHTLAPSRKFRDAVMRLAALIDGAPLAQVQSHPVQVQALGEVRPGSLVYGNSRRCANPGCPVWFVPRAWNQTVCGDECRKAWKKWKRASLAQAKSRGVAL